MTMMDAHSREVMKISKYTDLREKVVFLRQYHTEAAERLDVFYGRTLAMIDYFEGGGDTDKGLQGWTKLIQKLADIKVGGAGYYNAHITNLVNMVDEAVKETQEQERNNERI